MARRENTTGREEEKERRKQEDSGTESPTQQEIELAVAVYQILEAITHFQSRQDDPVSILVPAGKSDLYRSIDLESAIQQVQLPITRDLSFHEVRKLSEIWNAVRQAVPMLESDEIQQVVIITLTMDIMSRLHTHYTNSGLPDLIQKRGIPYESFAHSNLYPQLLMTLFALDIYTEMVGRAPKLIVPTREFMIPPGNA